jgi:hypothetical protein
MSTYGVEAATHAKRNLDSTILKKFLVHATISALALFISLSAWALSSPLGSSPDEDFHIGSIWCAKGFVTDTCEDKKDKSSSLLPDVYSSKGVRIVSVPHVMDICFIGKSDKSGDCSLDRKSEAPLLRANDNMAYPPIYYKFMDTFLDSDTQASGMTMRLVNSLIASLLLFFAIVLSSTRTRNSMLIGITSTLVPLGMFLIPSLNPSAWAYLSSAFSWIFLTNAISSQNTSKGIRNVNWVLFFICLVMAFGSRWDAGIYILVSTGAVLALNGSGGEYFKNLNQLTKLILRTSFAVALIALIYYYLPRVFEIAKSGIFPEDDSKWEPINLFTYNVVHLIELPAGTFGFDQWGLGWFDTPLPAVVSFVGTAIYSFFLLQSMPFYRLRNYCVLGALFAFTALVLMFSLTASGIQVGDTVQPRYILPMMPIIIGMAVWSSRTGRPFGSDPIARAIITGILIAVANAVSLWTNIKRYTVGLEKHQNYSLNASIEWWWEWAPSPNFVFMLGVFSFSIFIYAAFKLILMQSESKTELTVSRSV